MILFCLKFINNMYVKFLDRHVPNTIDSFNYQFNKSILEILKVDSNIFQ